MRVFLMFIMRAAASTVLARNELNPYVRLACVAAAAVFTPKAF